MSSSKSAKNPDISLSSSRVPAATEALPYTARHQEALDLELSLLGAALKRNGASHRRTLYYRRLNMALQCLYRHKLDAVFRDWQELFSDDLHQLEQELEKERKIKAQNKKRQEIFWEIKVGDTKSDAQKQPKQPTDDLSARFLLLAERVEDLAKRTCTGITECLSRLEYAAEACFTEIGRGFFLPFLTVAVGCAARIRTLLLRLQSYLAVQFQTALGEEFPLWSFCNDEMKKLRKGIVDMIEAIGSTPDASPPKVSTRAQLTVASLISLGIVLPDTDATAESKAVQDVPIEFDGAVPLENAAVNDSTAVTSDAPQEPTVGPRVSSTSHEQDMGESVGIFIDTPDSYRVEARSNGTQLSLSAALKSQVDDAGVDQNAVVLQKLRHKKASGGNKVSAKKKSKKQEKTTPAEDFTVKAKRKTAEDTSAKAKKKKKKKKKDGDFFDALFG
jgi:hypothetical protein